MFLRHKLMNTNCYGNDGRKQLTLTLLFVVSIALIEK